MLGYDLKRAGAYHVGACPFCGGRDRFTVKHTPQGDRWHCRHCGGGKYHSVIDFVMRRDDSDFRTALATLGGGAGLTKSLPAQPVPQVPVRLPGEDWQRAAWREVDTASDTLLGMANDAPAWQYLTRRGLKRPTVEAWHVGFSRVYDPTVRQHRGAIVLPWFDLDSNRETMQAVKYRFIDGGEGLRYSSKKGSTFAVPFGVWAALPKYHRGLLLVEGEINCLSCWQVEPSRLAILSLGSDGGGDALALTALAAKFRDVFVWVDTWDTTTKHAENLRGLVRGRGKALQSVMRDGVKYDANYLLQTGDLHEFMTAVFGTKVKN